MQAFHGKGHMKQTRHEAATRRDEYMHVHIPRRIYSMKYAHGFMFCFILFIWQSLEDSYELNNHSPSILHSSDPEPLFTSEWTSYLKISWSLEAARLGVIITLSLLIMTASRKPYCRGACQISKRLEWYKPETRGFENSRNPAVRRPPV